MPQCDQTKTLRNFQVQKRDFVGSCPLATFQDSSRTDMTSQWGNITIEKVLKEKLCRVWKPMTGAVKELPLRWHEYAVEARCWVYPSSIALQDILCLQDNPVWIGSSCPPSPTCIFNSATNVLKNRKLWVLRSQLSTCTTTLESSSFSCHNEPPASNDGVSPWRQLNNIYDSDAQNVHCLHMYKDVLYPVAFYHFQV